MMCLQKVNEIISYKDMYCRTGYKFFKPKIDKLGRNIGLLPLYRGVKVVPMNEWIEDNNHLGIMGSSIPEFLGFDERGIPKYQLRRLPYPPGFHIFTELDEVKESALYHTNNVLCEVQYRHMVAIGVDHDMQCVVARAMKLIKKL